MPRDFVNQAGEYHRAYLRDAANRAELEALRREARTRRMAAALGHRLIAIGERLVDTPSTKSERLDRAA